MGDSFQDTLSDLVAGCPQIQSAVFADFDGEDIATHPTAQRDELRLCAAYGGIALRRLGSAEERAARKPVRAVTMTGADGTLAAFMVGDEYQLVIRAAKGTPAGLLRFHAGPAVARLEDNI
jgi:predicted regulator of Ras-like GTPase activity (Roadblock/LC7/MglB family)